MLPRLRRFLPYALAVVGLIAGVTTARAWPVEAQGHRVEPGVIVDEVLGVGVLESAREVRVAFEASGRVTALAVDEGAMWRWETCWGRSTPRMRRGTSPSRRLSRGRPVRPSAAHARSWSAHVRGPAVRRRSELARTLYWRRAPSTWRITRPRASATRARRPRSGR
jgi:hypothetical protein